MGVISVLSLSDKDVKHYYIYTVYGIDGKSSTGSADEEL